MKSTSLYNLTMVPAATPALMTSAKRLMAIEIYGGSETSSVEVKNNLTDGGTVLFSATTPALTSSPLIDFTGVGGITFSTGIFVKPAGTGALVYVWTD